MFLKNNTFKYFLAVWILLISKTQGLNTNKNQLKSLEIHDESSRIKESKENLPKDLPCPEADDIRPCSCSYDDNFYMTMECSNITSEEELRTVFNQTYPLYDFYELRIVNNLALDSLQEGVFGLVTFEKIFIYNVPNLSSIDSNVFHKMNDTLNYLLVAYCNLDSLEFNFENFPLLTEIHLYDNGIPSFDLNSPNVNRLSLESNELNENNFYANVPNLEHLYLYQNQFTRVPNISSYSKLIELHLEYNFIQNVSESEICHLEYLDRVHISGNNISSIETNSICVRNGSNVDLHSNQIVTIDKAVFQPFIINVTSGQLYLYDNPLVCGCDIAWLFPNNDVDKIDSETTCSGSGGGNIHDLDPVLFQNLCDEIKL